ncbi:MAG: transcriptional repressor, partial [Sphingopyxis sp.]
MAKSAHAHHHHHEGQSLTDAARDALIAAGEQWTQMRADIFAAIAAHDKPTSA